jgi:CRP-like cAMP-binding protein
MDSKRGRSPFVAKLSHFAPLSDEDVRVLDGLCRNEERLQAGAEIAAEGDVPFSFFVLMRGMAYRYRLLPEGRRQILTFLIPGDFFDLDFFLLNEMDHSVRTIVPSGLAAIDRDIVIDVILRRPRIGAALWWSAMQENAMMRERVVTLGRRNARSKLAYILCEFVWRLRAVGMAEDDEIRLPLTQADLADTLGLTAVHVNRILQGFRRDQLITLEQRRLTLRNFEMLKTISGLTPNYLHLDNTPIKVLRYFDNLEADRPRFASARSEQF